MTDRPLVRCSLSNRPTTMVRIRRLKKLDLNQQPNGQIDHSNQQQDGQVDHSTSEETLAEIAAQMIPRQKGTKRRTGKKRSRLVPGLPPELPVEDQLAHLINLLGVDRNPICTLPRLLNKTDVTPLQARLQIAYDDARGLLECPDITDGEKALMAHSKNKLEMAAYDRRGNRYLMRFAKVASIEVGRGMYRLTGAFGPFLRENRLQMGHTLVMWVLRLPMPPEMEEKHAMVGTLAMVLLDYKTRDEAELKTLEAADWHALQDGMATRGLLQLMASGEVTNIGRHHL